jgi:hypothetical protein
MVHAPRGRRKGVATKQRGRRAVSGKDGSQKDFADKTEREDIRRQAVRDYYLWVQMNLTSLHSTYRLAIPDWSADVPPVNGRNAREAEETEGVTDGELKPQSEAEQRLPFRVPPRPYFWDPTTFLTRAGDSDKVMFIDRSHSREGSGLMREGCLVDFHSDFEPGLFQFPIQPAPGLIFRRPIQDPEPEGVTPCEIVPILPIPGYPISAKEVITSLLLAGGSCKSYRIDPDDPGQRILATGTFLVPVALLERMLELGEASGWREPLPSLIRMVRHLDFFCSLWTNCETFPERSHS